MNKQQEALSQEQQEKELKRRIREVMSSAPDGMDEESLKAGVVLLHEIETRQILLELLQTRNIYAEIREDGVPVFYVCEGTFETTTDSEKAA